MTWGVAVVGLVVPREPVDVTSALICISGFEDHLHPPL
jgi:hypothetical protein